MRFIICLVTFTLGCSAHMSSRRALPLDTTSELPDCAGPGYSCSDDAYVSSEKDED